MKSDEKNESDFRDGMPFLGGARWIDLLNSTLSPDGGVTVVDFLKDDRAFALWLANAGFATNNELASERRASAALRDELRSAFDQLAAGTAVPKRLLERVNALLSEAPFVRQVECRSKGDMYSLEEHAFGKSHGVTAQIAGDFAAFLTDHEPERLKHCASPACTMVFYDRGKNNRRRWCSSGLCGNRDKVANYRARKASHT